jgi:hypothetical protein
VNRGRIAQDEWDSELRERCVLDQHPDPRPHARGPTQAAQAADALGLPTRDVLVNLRSHMRKANDIPDESAARLPLMRAVRV